MEKENSLLTTGKNTKANTHKEKNKVEGNIFMEREEIFMKENDLMI